jgi:hypothetical protein
MATASTRVIDPSVAILVRLDLIDFGGNGERRRPFTGGFESRDDAQGFALYPAKSPGH